MLFNDFEFKDYIVKALEDLEFEDLTNVQKQVLLNFNKEDKLLIKSKTGSGKTHAFLLPIFNSLDETKKEVQAVIITPTAELANQVYKVCSHIASFYHGEISIKLYLGGTDRLKEIKSLTSKQPQIVIGTPGKIKDLVIDENVLKIYTAKYFVIDEVDMALQFGYLEHIGGILEVLKDSKTILSSATISKQMEVFIKKYISNVKYIDISSDLNLSIKHIWIPIKSKDRINMLINLTKVINPYLALVFVNKKETISLVVNALVEQNYKVGTIHGDLSPRVRKKEFAKINNLEYQYIVCSDLASRGIDIDGVSHVINYEIPKDYEFYVHRSGRTGRMNYDGICYSLYEDLDEVYLQNLEKKNVVVDYKEIKNNELVEYKGRNVRQKRIKPEEKELTTAKKMLKKPKKVKPGYKKKFNEEANKLAKKIKNKNKKS